MQTRTRYFLLGSVAILLAGLCVGLVAYVGAGAPAPQAGTPDELSLLPAESAVVAYADVQAVMASSFRQRLLEALPSEHRAPDRIREATGIDVERDIDSVVAGFVPDGATDEREGSPLIVVKGRFDATRLEAVAVEHGGTAGEHAGIRLVDFESEREPGTVAFFAPGVLVVGDDALVRQAIDRGMNGGGVRSNEVVMQLIGAIEPGSSAWAVGRVEAMNLEGTGQLSPEMASRIPAIEWFSASTRINGGLSGNVRAEARDEQAAQDLRQVAQGFLALARLQTNESPELRPLFDSLQFGGSGRTVALSFDLPIEVIDGLEQLFRERNAAPAGP